LGLFGYRRDNNQLKNTLVGMGSQGKNRRNSPNPKPPNSTPLLHKWLVYQNFLSPSDFQIKWQKRKLFIQKPAILLIGGGTKL